MAKMSSLIVGTQSDREYNAQFFYYFCCMYHRLTFPTIDSDKNIVLLECIDT